LEAKYKKLLNNPAYKTLSSQVRVTGTWDDHDFGENDGGATYPMKRKSKELFWDFMQVPKGSVLREQDGVYRSEVWTVGSKKVKLIILDTRYMRDPVLKNPANEYIPTEGDMLGSKQWLWLEKEFSESQDVEAIVVANGTQVLGDQHRFEKWANFPKSKERLLSLLDDSPAKIKILLSGDRHFGEISQLKLPKGSVVTEVVSSGLTHSYEKANEPNPMRVGGLWAQTHFALMDFYLENGDLSVKLSLEDIKTNQSVNSVEVKGDASVSGSL
jgi:alkaline phosphatase D